MATKIQGDADQGKRQRILYLAGTLFLKQGYAATSIRQIARELNISLGLVSYYFPTKRDIAVELLTDQLHGTTALLNKYLSVEEDPILFSGALTKLQGSILSSPYFMSFYKDALREDIAFDVIAASGVDTYQHINRKYNLGLTEDYLILYGNFISASMERALVLYAKENNLVGSVPDMVFLTYMGRFYGSREFLIECCKKTDQIVARIFVENPDILSFWCNLKPPQEPGDR